MLPVICDYIHFVLQYHIEFSFPFVFLIYLREYYSFCIHINIELYNYRIKYKSLDSNLRGAKRDWLGLYGTDVR